MNVQERYSPYPVAANTTIQMSANAVGGFLCIATGTITIVRNASGSQPSLTVVAAFPVAAGTYYPMPFYMGTEGFSFTTSLTASGVLGVA
jgi:hypothetical protein